MRENRWINTWKRPEWLGRSFMLSSGFTLVRKLWVQIAAFSWSTQLKAAKMFPPQKLTLFSDVIPAYRYQPVCNTAHPCAAQTFLFAVVALSWNSSRIQGTVQASQKLHHNRSDSLQHTRRWKGRVWRYWCLADSVVSVDSHPEVERIQLASIIIYPLFNQSLPTRRMLYIGGYFTVEQGNLKYGEI